ncbi:MAG: glycosyltransferase family 39 protein [Myxococcales bacterium]
MLGRPEDQGVLTPSMATRRTTALVLLAITAAGAAVRLWDVTDQSVWLDEAASLLHARRPWAELLSSSVDPGNPPLYYLGLKAWCALFGTGELALRLPAALCGIAAIPLAFLVARELFDDERIGLFAAALLAVLPAHVYYSQESRQYAPLVLSGLVTAWAYLVALRTDRRAAWIAMAVSGALGFWLHYNGALVAVVIAVHVLLFARRPRAFACLAACAALCVPTFVLYLLPALRRGSDGWQGYFTLASVLDWASSLFGWIVMPDEPLWANVPAALSLAVAILAPLVLAAVASRSASPGLRRGLSFAALYFLLPFVLWAALCLARPLWHPRYQLVAAPGWVLLAAWALGTVSRKPRLALGAFIAFPCLLSLSTAHFRWLKADWREAASVAQSVETASRGPGRVLVTMPFQEWPLAYYHRGAWPRTGFEAGHPADCTQLRSLTAGEGTTVLIQANAADGDPSLAVAKALARAHGGGYLRSLVGIRVFAFGSGAAESGGLPVTEADLTLPGNPCP